jgi:hypothetical protein
MPIFAQRVTFGNAGRTAASPPKDGFAVVNERDPSVQKNPLATVAKKKYDTRGPLAWEIETRVLELLKLQRARGACARY